VGIGKKPMSTLQVHIRRTSSFALRAAATTASSAVMSGVLAPP